MSQLKCTRQFIAEWRVRALYSEHQEQIDLDAADDVLHDAEVAHDILARAETAEARIATLESALAACRGERDATCDNMRKRFITAPRYELFFEEDGQDILCLVCDGQWKLDAPEAHQGNCPCALASKESAGETGVDPGVQKQ